MIEIGMKIIIQINIDLLSINYYQSSLFIANFAIMLTFKPYVGWMVLVFDPYHIFLYILS